MSFILKLATRAREAGRPVTLNPPLADVPTDVLGVALDPHLRDIYRVSNGLDIDEFYISEIRRGKDCPLRDYTISARDMLDPPPLLNDVLLWGYFDGIQVDITSIPALADDHGRQPVVILDLNEAPYIMPLASTVHRAVALIVEDCILANGSREEREPLPYDTVDMAASDTRLMQLIDDGAFHALGVEIEEEWLDMLHAARARAAGR